MGLSSSSKIHFTFQFLSLLMSDNCNCPSHALTLRKQGKEEDNLTPILTEL